MRVPLTIEQVQGFIQYSFELLFCLQGKEKTLKKALDDYLKLEPEVRARYIQKSNEYQRLMAYPKRTKITHVLNALSDCESEKRRLEYFLTCDDVDRSLIKEAQTKIPVLNEDIALLNLELEECEREEKQVSSEFQESYEEYRQNKRDIRDTRRELRTNMRLQKKIIKRVKYIEKKSVKNQKVDIKKLSYTK